MFNPFTLYCNNKKIPAVNLAPVAVHPDYQGKGIGSKLIRKGHEIAVKKGYIFSYLWGHPTYYPRLGYRQKAFAQGGILIDINEIPVSQSEVKTRIPGKFDIKYLTGLWKKLFSDVSLSIYPGISITDWVSYTKDVKTFIMIINGKSKGYVRYREGRENKPLMLLAEDEDSLLSILGFLKSKMEYKEDKVLIPLHPNCNFIKNKLRLSYENALRTSEAFMIYVLEDNIRDKNRFLYNNPDEVNNLVLFILTPHFDLT